MNENDCLLPNAIWEAMQRYFKWYKGKEYDPERFEETLDELSIWSDNMSFRIERFVRHLDDDGIFHIVAYRDPLEVHITEYNPVRHDVINMTDSQ